MFYLGRKYSIHFDPRLTVTAQALAAIYKDTMKILLLISILLVSSISQSQIEITGKWKMNFPFESGKVKTYILSNFEADVEYYGNLELTPEGTFKSYDAWPCGNDCFRSWVGTYEIINP